MAPVSGEMEISFNGQGQARIPYTWSVRYQEKNTFLEVPQEDNFEGGRGLRRSSSESSIYDGRLVTVMCGRAGTSPGGNIYEDSTTDESISRLSVAEEPCSFVQSAQGCAKGGTDRTCNFSNLEHVPPQERLKKHKKKLRPCKGKRDRYRKLMNNLMDVIDRNQGDFDVDAFLWPPSIEGNAACKAGAKKKLADYASAKMLMHYEWSGSGSDASTFSSDGAVA
jgi:hypothetical protein